ncbi:hypothetical protein D3C78_1216610 [compost metagenome]
MGLRDGLFPRRMESRGAGCAAGIVDSGADSAQLADAYVRPAAFSGHIVGDDFLSARHDVLVLCCARDGWHAASAGINRWRAGILDGKPGTQSRHASLYGLCARLALCVDPSGCRTTDRADCGLCSPVSV